MMGSGKGPRNRSGSERGSLDRVEEAPDNSLHCAVVVPCIPFAIRRIGGPQGHLSVITTDRLETQVTPETHEQTRGIPVIGTEKPSPRGRLEWRVPL
jgi:hypothetical protein